MFIELSAKTLLRVGNPRQRLGRDLELAIAECTDSHSGYDSQPFDDSKIARCHKSIIKPAGQSLTPGNWHGSARVSAVLRDRTGLYHTQVVMPAYTEGRIRQLCLKALAAEKPADIERVLTELRAALTEHIRLAKDSLDAQIRTMSFLDAVANRAANSDP